MCIINISFGLILPKCGLLHMFMDYDYTGPSNTQAFCLLHWIYWKCINMAPIQYHYSASLSTAIIHLSSSIQPNHNGTVPRHAKKCIINIYTVYNYHANTTFIGTFLEFSFSQLFSFSYLSKDTSRSPLNMAFHSGFTSMHIHFISYLCTQTFVLWCE